MEQRSAMVRSRGGRSWVMRSLMLACVIFCLIKMIQQFEILNSKGTGANKSSSTIGSELERDRETERERERKRETGRQKEGARTWLAPTLCSGANGTDIPLTFYDQLDDAEDEVLAAPLDLLWPSAVPLQTRGCSSLHPYFWSEGCGSRPMDRLIQLLNACPKTTLDVGELVMDPEGHPVASMTAPACMTYFLSGASVNRGIALEFGTWAGGSTRCMAGGVNLTGKADRVYGLDLFKVGRIKSNTKKLERFLTGTRWESRFIKDGPAFDMKQLFLYYTRSVYPTIRAKQIDLDVAKKRLQERFDHKAIDLWTTDAAKDWQKLVRQLSAVQPYLNAGAVVILADLFYQTADVNPEAPDYAQIQYVYAHLVPEYLELIAVVNATSHAFFGLKKALPRAAIASGLPESRPHQLWLDVQTRAKADVSRVERDPSVVLYKHWCIDMLFQGWAPEANVSVVFGFEPSESKGEVVED